MIPSSGLTYGRYLHMGQHTAPLPTRQAEDEAEKPRRRPAKALEAAELKSEMNDLVYRLNSRSEPLGRGISFRLEEGLARTSIVMTEQDQVISRFHGDDITYLERSLYDMAGFRISIEG